MTQALKPICDAPSAVANFFLEKGKDDGVPITPMKLIKLIYIAHGWCLGAKNTPLFSEEIKAWKFGPVMPSIYHEFKHFGGEPIIDFLSREYDPFEDMDADTPCIPKDHNDVLNTLELVWDLYKDKSATSLMKLTHQKNTPWDKVWNVDQDRINGQIDSSLICDHYKNLIESLLKNAE